MEILRDAHRRMVTLTGSGGVGKTRLAIEVARQMFTQFDEGSTFVDFSPVRDEALVFPTLATSLGLRKQASQSALETIVENIDDAHVLVVLDNFEQVRASAPHIASLLSSCPFLRVLTTSRVPLHISGEQEYPLLPLTPPDSEEHLDLGSIRHNDAVRLFLQQARLVRPSFELTTDNAGDIARVCRQLDGLPLAIELAAARVKSLSPRRLVRYLDHPLALLESQAADVPERHRTLRRTIAWSYGLLSLRDQYVFRCLSLFSGGWTFDAAAAVLDPRESSDRIPFASESAANPPAVAVDEESLLAVLTTLVDHNLVRSDEQDGEVRFSMLETMRDYGQEQLRQLGEYEVLQRRVAHHYLQLAERAETKIFGLDETLWLDYLDREINNIRAVLAWWSKSAGNVELGLRLASSLWMFWDIRNRIDEGQQWLTHLLTHSSARTTVHAKSLFTAGYLATRQGTPTKARPLLEQALSIYRELEDEVGIGRTLGILGAITSYEGNHQLSRSLLEESLQMFRSAGDSLGVGRTLLDLGDQVRVEGDYLRAQVLLEESLMHLRGVGFQRGAAWAVVNLGNTARAQGNIERARELFNESRRMFESVGDRRGLSRPVLYLANLARVDREYSRALTLFEESLELLRQINDQWRLPVWLYYVALLLHQRGRHRASVQLIAAAYASRDDFQTLLDPDEQQRREQGLKAAKTTLGEDDFWQAWTAGQSIDLHAAIDRGLFMLREVAQWQSSELRIHLLGEFTVQAGEVAIGSTDWRLRKSASLFKMVALTPSRRVHRDQVIEQLWPDLPLPAALNNFYQALHSARVALAGLSPAIGNSRILQIDRQVLSIDPSLQTWTDVQAFEAMAQRASETGDPDDYVAALDLYRGDLLPEDLYEDWTVERRISLRGAVSNLLLSLARHYEAVQDYDSAIRYYRRAIEHDSLLETAHNHLVQLYTRLGRRHEALRQYERLRQTLADEFGIKPDTPPDRPSPDLLSNEERTPREDTSE